jgi:oxalate decarboxylase
MNTDRRVFLGAWTAGSAALALQPALAASDDGHANGHDVAAAAPSDRRPVLPRRPGEPPAFTASLDHAALKATSGGWAREITSRQLPIATGIAGAHLFLAPGGIREMHWHASAEWAYILDGQCQVTVIDPNGPTEVVNFGAGDVWYFPAGHGHSIQALGTQPCHAILAFDDGLYGEHGTFGLTDWISRLDPMLLGMTLAQPAPTFAAFPGGETYIMQGEVLLSDGPEARMTHEFGPDVTHRHRLMDRAPETNLPGGTMHLASAFEFPRSASMSGFVLRLESRAAHAPHWHPNANEWMYVARGSVRVTLFTTDKHLGTAVLSPGDCAYVPRSCGHSVENFGDQPCEIIGVTDSGTYVEATLADWFARAPRHVLAANLGVEAEALPTFARRYGRIVTAG